MIYDYYKEKNKRTQKWSVVILLSFLAIFLLMGTVSRIYLEIIQLDEIGGFSEVYITNLTYKIIFSVISFAIIFILFFITNTIIKKNINSHLEKLNKPIVKVSRVFIPFIVALIGAISTKDIFYSKVLTFFNSEAFGITDPIFDKDISYYVFQRPFLIALLTYLEVLAFVMIVYSLLYYLRLFIKTFQLEIDTALSKNSFATYNVRSILTHNLMNVAIYFVIKAFSYGLKKEGVLYNTFLNVTGANYIDVTVWLKYYTVAPYLLIIITLFSLFFIKKAKFKKAIITMGIFPFTWAIVTAITIGLHAFVVDPNELKYEEQYLRNNMINTVNAYGLNKIKSVEFPEIKDLTPEILDRNAGTKNNIRIIDYASTLQSNVQLQSNTNFYTFEEGDIVNYAVNEDEIPIFITAREIDKNKIPEKSYLNTLFRYTHGYGVVINPINRITDKGQVEFILSGLRLNSIDENIKINEPRIYFGELTDDHVIVNASDNLNEIDYDGDLEYRYTGDAGINLGFINRVLFSWKYRDFRMLISNYITKDSKILLNRQVVDRAQKAFPFLVIDGDPYIIISEDGKLKWILDGYTVTDKYPYSQMTGNLNYIRNSVKIVIDAYDGEAKGYIIDKNDPMIKTYAKIYPTIFTNEEMPKFLKSHMRYPETLFKIQTQLLRRYHISPDNVNAFYSNQNLWNIAQYPDSKSSSLVDIDAYYNMIKLPGEIGQKEELILMRPFTPSGKLSHNLAGWLAVRNSYDYYGEMILFRFPRTKNIFGPNQVSVKINQIDEISKDKTLWGSVGSDVYEGDLLIIPIENTLLYVQPILIKSSGDSSTPEVKRVIVGYQREDNFIDGVGENLDEALNDLFKGATIPSDEGETAKEIDQGSSVDQEIINNIMSKYDSIKAQLNELGLLIEELN